MIATPTFAIDSTLLLTQAATFFTQWLSLIYLVGGLTLALALVTFVIATIKRAR